MIEFEITEFGEVAYGSHETCPMCDPKRVDESIETIEVPYGLAMKKIQEDNEMLVEKDHLKDSAPGVFVEGQTVRTPLGVGKIIGYENGKWLVEHETGATQSFQTGQLQSVQILKG